MVKQLKRLLRFTPLVLALIFLLGSSRPAHAQDQCFIHLIDCVQRAANETSYWRSVAATADCELDVVGCVRKAIFGR
jgi:hypothetical protein